LKPGAGGSGTGAGSAGNVQVVGNFMVTGTKNALVETASYGKRQLYAGESPKNWFEDFGGAQLIHGRATIKLDPIFAETVSTDQGYYVFLTPKGDCEGRTLPFNPPLRSRSENCDMVRVRSHLTTASWPNVRAMSEPVSPS
jgi:hypothetical protein